jgi:hypothetical protein
LRRRLMDELPESPSADNVASISAAWRQFEDLMEKSWEEDLAFSWTSLKGKKRSSD